MPKWYAGGMTEIENEAAWQAAKQRNIAANRRKTGMKKWQTVPDREQLYQLLERRVSAATRSKYGDGQLTLRDARELSFIDACWLYLEEAGCPTDGQIEALRRMIATDAQKRAERNAEAAARSNHVGTVGARQSFTLRATFVTSFDGMYGTTYVHGFEDEAGNVYIYKGSAKLAEKGETITFKATIKEHGERDGVKQTVLARPAK